jgi:hypothetical protein
MATVAIEKERTLRELNPPSDEWLCPLCRGHGPFGYHRRRRKSRVDFQTTSQRPFRIPFRSACRKRALTRADNSLFDGPPKDPKT